MSQSEKKLSKKERAEIHREKQDTEKHTRKHFKLASFLSFLFPKGVPWINQIVGAFLMLFSFFLLSVLSLFFYRFFTQAQDLSKILPEDSTILFAEGSFSSESVQSLKSLSSNTQFSLSKLIEKFDSLYNIHFEQDVKPWMGSKIGFALQKNANSSGNPNLLIFLQYIDSQKAKHFFNSLALKDKEHLTEFRYKSWKMYEFPLSQKFVFSFYYGYVIASPSKDALFRFFDSIADKQPKLRYSANFIPINNNLSPEKLIFLYINVQSAMPYLSRLSGLKNYIPQLSYVEPLLEIFPAFGASLIPKKYGFALSTYSSISKKELKDQRLFAKKEKFNADLLSFIPRNADFMLSGVNLLTEVNRLLEILKEKNPYSADIIEGALRYQKTRYFGENIDLKKDIFPLFSNEYAFAGFKENTARHYLLIQRLSKPDEGSKTITLLKDGFIQLNAFFDPYIKTTIIDGKPIKEIFNPSGLINELKLEHKKIPITVLFVPGLDFEISYAIKDDLFIFSTSQKHIRDVLDLMTSQKQASSLDDYFSFNFGQKIISFSDEIFFYHLTPHDNEPLFSLFPITMMFSGTNVFDDGIATVSYLRLADKSGSLGN